MIKYKSKSKTMKVKRNETNHNVKQ